MREKNSPSPSELERMAREAGAVIESMTAPATKTALWGAVFALSIAQAMLRGLTPPTKGPSEE